ncbi:Acyl_transf_3 domain-containing protein [Caenorhabditis elegans]|uniref:Acyl_transf_3 domain-containing protein n=1 Tax=Caenorhabditis elegans TaxID=6239 RepID=O62230_CAEEL|nr:Acyl_transf_3 domain-containing protein [Caenorhabditis elegans]CAB04287.1 Acyl_transf_3 domain-containing protein [Caenorhabditis elegans]|eukprot:NP_492984.1 O-ACyltransferase homolog [Caenorhabditis elegans]
MGSLPIKLSPKRLDLQGIRGLAIIAVLGFHFYPDTFPNGYLGVDQFFVLSGFLMCMLLKRAKKEPPCTLITIFYTKRFRRILPLYLLVICCSMICLYAFFPEIVVETNQKSALRALFFVSNTQKTEAQNYFMKLTKAMDIFTHTWSLSVEVQFYFLIPFIFLLAAKLPSKFEIKYYAFIGIVSFSFFFSSPQSVAFNSVFARIWQFSIGIIVYLLEYSKLQNRKETQAFESLLIDEDCKNMKKQPSSSYPGFTRGIAYLLMSSLVLIVSLSIPLNVSIARPLLTIGTGCLMLISEGNAVLSNRVLTYIGDISYSLYLVHWPIYAYWKLTNEDNKSLLVVALLNSILLAVFVFEIFEKWYLKLTSSKLALLVILLFSLNMVLVNRDEFANQMEINRNDTNTRQNRTSNAVTRHLLIHNVSDDMTIDDAIRLNNDWNIHDIQNLNVPYCKYETQGPLAWCSHQGLNATSKYKLMIIGNSWTANHGTLFHQECGYKANSIIQGSFSECEMIHTTFNREECINYYKSFRDRVKKEKPDYLFIVIRYLTVGDPMPKNVTEFNDDPIYQSMKSQLLEFLSGTKRMIYILNALPSHNNPLTREIMPWLKQGITPIEVEKRLGHVAGMPFKQATYELARKRYAELVKECNGRCGLVDYKLEFYNNATKTYKLFDERGFEYFTSGIHISPHGLEKVRHIWTDVCAKL